MDDLIQSEKEKLHNEIQIILLIKQFIKGQNQTKSKRREKLKKWRNQKP